LCSKGRKEGYLAALLDGEGSVAKASEKVAVIYNSDPDLIAAGIFCSVHLGFESLTLSVNSVKGYKDMWTLHFYTQSSFRKLLQTPLQVRNKISRLEAILASYKGRQRKDWSRTSAVRFHNQGWSPVQIAKRLGVDYTTIEFYFKSKGIKKNTRPPSRHGTHSKYGMGCRCEPCKEANRVYKREWYHKNKQRKEA